MRHASCAIKKRPRGTKCAGCGLHLKRTAAAGEEPIYMTKLPLAVDIADAACEADASRSTLDLDQKAGQLQDAHPEADATREEIVTALQATSGRSTGYRHPKR